MTVGNGSGWAGLSEEEKFFDGQADVADDLTQESG
jgi:hypothetical protein